MKSKYIIGLVFVLSAILSAPIAQATPINNINDFPADATTILTFDGLPLGPVATQYQSLGVTSIEGGAITFLAPNQVLSTNSQIVIQFSVNVDMVGVDFVSTSPLWLEA